MALPSLDADKERAANERDIDVYWSPLNLGLHRIQRPSIGQYRLLIGWMYN